MALRPVQKMKIKVVKKLSATERGEKGFGSTGI
jgi:dUTPase